MDPLDAALSIRSKVRSQGSGFRGRLDRVWGRGKGLGFGIGLKPVASPQGEPVSFPSPASPLLIATDQLISRRARL